MTKKLLFIAAIPMLLALRAHADAVPTPSLSAQSLLGTWKGELTIDFQGNAQSQPVTMTFESKGVVKIVAEGKNETNQYSVSGIKILFTDAGKKEPSAVFTATKATATLLQGSLVPTDVKALPAGVKITLKLSK